MMTKKTRALVTAGAGAAVLLASGATFALWQDTTELTSTSVQTGTLELDGATLTWSDISPDAVNPGVIDTSEFLMVPGDHVQGVSSDIAVDWVGDNFDYVVTLTGADGVELQDDFEAAGFDINSHVNDAGQIVVNLDWRGANEIGPSYRPDEYDFTLTLQDIDTITVTQVRPGGEGLLHPAN